VTSEKKAAARRTALAAREALAATERDAAVRAVTERLAGLPELRDARSVLAYAAMWGELDPAFAVASLRAAGARIAYPRVCAPGEMTLHWADDEAELAPGYCGIREPPADSAQASPDDFDLVLVPGVAFDESCCRLGHGGGFYDRLLLRLRPGTLVVGLAFDEQIVGSLPREPHDALLDIVVTPTRVLRRP
jgi:5-formyltetrahydrofolate cyclo-ligase